MKDKGKKSNDMFDYEKEWQLYKGNEYMFHLLRKMRPKISNNCPHSYLVYQKMPKNNMSDANKEHERIRENRRLKKKLSNIHASNSTVYNYIEAYPKIPLLQQQHFNITHKHVKQTSTSQLLLDNTQMYKRINDCKSFFSTVKCYNSVNQEAKPRKPKTRQARSSSMRNVLQNTPTLDSFRSINLNNNHNITGIICDSQRLKPFFLYTEYNEHLQSNKIEEMSLYKKNRYIVDFGLIGLRIKYEIMKLTLIIEPFSTHACNIYYIYITDEQSLSLLPIMYKTFDEMAFSLRYEREEFILKNVISGFSYATHYKPKEKNEYTFPKTVRTREYIYDRKISQ